MRSSLLVLASLLVPTVAHAGGIVLESYTQGRPADADKYLSPMLDVLTKSGFVAGADSVGRPFDRDVSRSAIEKAGLPIDFDKQVEAAKAKFRNGAYHDAIAALAPLVELAHANAGAFANREDLRNRVLREAHVMLAVAQQLDGDKNAALATFTEILRSFPDERVAAGTYGAESNKLFLQAKATVTQGRLTVTSKAPSGGIYLDEHLEGLGTVTKTSLVAGDYRVFVQNGRDVSRVHVVTVKPGEEVTLTIDSDFDQVVRTQPWSGLQFASGDARNAQESAFAAAYGNALGADQIVVIGIETVQNVPSVIGTLISKTGGDKVRSAIVPLTAASTPQLESLAHFVLGDGPATGDIKPYTRPVVDPNAVKTRIVVEREPRWRGWKWLALGGTAVALPAAIAFYHYDGRVCEETLADGHTCKTFKNLMPWAIGFGVGAAIFGGATIFLWSTEPDRSKHEPTSGAFVVPTSGGAMAGYSFTF